MAGSKMVRFPEGSVILKEGEVNAEMYKIIKGHAEVYTGYGTPLEHLLGIIGEQSCFGEFGLLLKKPSIYTVIAYSDILALRITEGEMGDFVRENHKNIIDIMRNMANSMMTMRIQIDLLLQEISAGKTMDDNDIKDAMRRATQTMRQYAVRCPFLVEEFDKKPSPAVRK